MPNENTTPVWLTITTAMVVSGYLSILDRFGPDHKPGQKDGSGGCIYYERDDNGLMVAVCLVGQFFADLGLLGMLEEDPGASYGSCPLGGFYVSASKALQKRGIAFEDAASFMLNVGQSRQDSGATWGDSIERAFVRAVTDYPEEVAHLFPQPTFTERAKRRRDYA